jgi:hypothetical protein
LSGNSISKGVIIAFGVTMLVLALKPGQAISKRLLPDDDDSDKEGASNMARRFPIFQLSTICPEMLTAGPRLSRHWRPVGIGFRQIHIALVPARTMRQSGSPAAVCAPKSEKCQKSAGAWTGPAAQLVVGMYVWLAGCLPQSILQLLVPSPSARALCVRG